MPVDILRTEYSPSEGLTEYVDGVWPALWAGYDVVIPEIHHDEIRASWGRPALSEPHGQISDRVLSTRGSRVHAREWSTGIWTLHADKWDPAQGPLAAGAHLVSETQVGRALAGIAFSGALAYAIGSYARARGRR